MKLTKQEAIQKYGKKVIAYHHDYNFEHEYFPLLICYHDNNSILLYNHHTERYSYKKVHFKNGETRFVYNEQILKLTDFIEAKYKHGEEMAKLLIK